MSTYYDDELQRITPREGEIHVTVYGAVASGRSTIAEAVRRALLVHGIQTTVDEGTETAVHSEASWRAYQSVRMQSIAERGTKVRIVTAQLPRNYRQLQTDIREEERQIIADRLYLMTQTGELDGLTAEDAIKRAIYLVKPS